ncbi:MAG: glycine cleavage system aminomethyltransferase GcvT [Planctomycetes bacterium]|nr:glycine cleavage system aminomethyltransferase GcvT [Planctomycetota bacterium]
MESTTQRIDGRKKAMKTKDNFLFDEELSKLDAEVSSLISEEAKRQEDKLIMIASESICPQPVLDALNNPYSNKYAEGYPSIRMTTYERNLIDKDHDRYLAFHRRYGDRRFYKGAEFCNIVEVLAQRRAAEIFATSDVPADKISVNVQSLSGAAANNAVYNAFVVPGDTVMGMALSYGGHLTHGSPFNRSGRQYKVVPYTVDMKTGKMDYELIRQLAMEHKPKMIIAGASAYPWSIDWKKLAEIARAVPVQIPNFSRPGAVLLADISHPSGLVVAGLFPNPVGHADVVTLTTHKTMCGPRGAIILSTSEEVAKRIDFGVFPGEQGGPHLNNILAKAVAFKLAATKEFKELQKRIVDNCQALAAALQKLGFTLAYGGTNSHLLLIDLSKMPGDIYIDGDVASNILDLCGITCNKNALPGDETGTRPRGIRLGTPILSQRGMGKAEMEKVAAIVHKVLTNIKPFKIICSSGRITRGKIKLEIMEEARKEVEELARKFPVNKAGSSKAHKTEAIEIIGERATAFLQSLVGINMYELKENAEVAASFLNEKGATISDSTIQRLLDTPEGYQHYLVKPEGSKADKLMTLLKGLSDGYIFFDEADIYSKVEGPVVIKSLRDEEFKSLRVEGAKVNLMFNENKPYFIGQKELIKSNKSQVTSKKSEFQEKPYEGERKTALYEEHLKLTKKNFMIPFAGWSMPVWYTRASEEHQAVREAAGLFDVSHMGKIEIKGPYATRFLDLVTTNYVPKMRNGQAHYSYILSPDGDVLDDAFLYKVKEDYYIIVVNASNAEKIMQWFKAVNERKVIIDRDNPNMELEGTVQLADLRDGKLTNIALQGKNSIQILQSLMESEKDKERLVHLKRSSFADFMLKGGVKITPARTGYTGEDIGFEMFVDYNQAVKLWQMLLEAGKPFGLKPCGLASRDSLRTEAGLPLYGHELSGGNNVIPTEAVYGSFVKRHKPFFIGRKAYLEKEAKTKRRIARFQITSAGARSIKPGDPVVSRRGEYLGVVTSCTLVGTVQTGLVLVNNKDDAKKGTVLRIYPLPPIEKEKPEKQKRQLSQGDQVIVPEEAVVVSRFPLRKN